MISVPTTVDMTYLNKKGIAMAFAADSSAQMVAASKDAATNVVNASSRLAVMSTPDSLITNGAQEVDTVYSSFSNAISSSVDGIVTTLNEGSFNMMNEEAKTHSFLLTSQPDNGTLQLLGVCVLEVPHRLHCTSSKCDDCCVSASCLVTSAFCQHSCGSVACSSCRSYSC